jgi:hypothetical protein
VHHSVISLVRGVSEGSDLLGKLEPAGGMNLVARSTWIVFGRRLLRLLVTLPRVLGGTREHGHNVDS